MGVNDCCNEPTFYVYETADLELAFKQEGTLRGLILGVISIKQENVIHSYSTNDSNVSVNIDENYIYLFLDQEETAKYKKGAANMQINLYFNNAERDATAYKDITIGDNMYKKVMP